MAGLRVISFGNPSFSGSISNSWGCRYQSRTEHKQLEGAQKDFSRGGAQVMLSQKGGLTCSLGGGFKDVVFSPLFGEDSQFD